MEAKEARWEGLRSTGVGGWVLWCVERSTPPTVTGKARGRSLQGRSPALRVLKAEDCPVQGLTTAEEARGSAQSPEVGGPTSFELCPGEKGKLAREMRVASGIVEVGDNDDILEPQ